MIKKNETTHIISATGTPHIDRPHTIIESEWAEAMKASCAQKRSSR